MAQVLEVRLVDDLDGGPAHGTHTLTLDGVSVEIELSNENFAMLQADVAKYFSHGRRAKSGPVRSRRKAKPAIPVAAEPEPEPEPEPRSERAAMRQHNAEIRAWARGQGMAVAVTGLIPQAVLAAYDAAHP